MACFRGAHHDPALHRRGAQHAADRAPRAAGTEALIHHHAIVREIAEAHGGRLFERIGDAAYSVFPSASDALTAGHSPSTPDSRQRSWGPIATVRVRTALDTGELGQGVGRAVLRPHPLSVRPNPVIGGWRRNAAVGHDRDRRGRHPPTGNGCATWGSKAARFGRHGARVGLVPAAVRADREPGRMIRLLLVDDDEVVRRGLRGFMELMPRIEIVGEASTARRRWTSRIGSSRT